MKIFNCLCLLFDFKLKEMDVKSENQTKELQNTRIILESSKEEMEKLTKERNDLKKTITDLKELADKQTKEWLDKVQVKDEEISALKQHQENQTLQTDKLVRR